MSADGGKAPEVSAATAIGSFDFTQQMPNQTSIAIHGYIFDKDKFGDLNERVDMFRKVASRQVLIAGLDMLDAQEKQAMSHIEQIKDHMVGLANKEKKSGMKLSQQEKTQMGQADATIKGATKTLEKIKTDRAELSEKIKALS
jgi:hypothetical protein